MTGRQKRAGRIMQDCVPFTGLQARSLRGGRDLPRRELSDEVVAHVQNFQFLSFTQPVWQGLHMVPAGGEGDDDDELCAVCKAGCLAWSIT